MFVAEGDREGKKPDTPASGLPQVYGHGMKEIPATALTDRSIENTKTYPYLLGFHQQWQIVQLAQARDSLVLNACFNNASLAFCNKFSGMLDTVLANRNKPIAEKMQAVQSYFNGYITYTTDEKVTVPNLRAALSKATGLRAGADDAEIRDRSEVKMDLWQSSWETLARKKGDCEDYMMAKREMLIAMGVPEDRLYTVIGYSRIDKRDLPKTADGGIDHARANGELYRAGNAYYGGHATLVVIDDDGKPWDLENYTHKSAWGRIDPASDKSEQFVPVYAFGKNGAFAFNSDEKGGLLSKIKSSITARATGMTNGADNDPNDPALSFN